MDRRLLIIPALLVFFAVGIIVAWAQQQSSGDRVLVIQSGSEQLTRQQYRDAFTVAAKGISGQSPTPDPPSYKNCAAGVADLQESRGQIASSLIKRQQICRQAEERLREQTMNTLVKTAWIERRGRELNIQISSIEIDNQRQLLQANYIGGKESFEGYLRSVGASRGEVNSKIRQELLEEKLIGRLDKKYRQQPSDKQLKEMYRQLKDRFAGQSFRQARPSLILIDRNIKIEQGRPRLVKKLEKLYQTSTVCAAGYLVELCGNWDQGSNITRAG